MGILLICIGLVVLAWTASQITMRALIERHPFDLRVFHEDGMVRETIFFDLPQEFRDDGFGDALGGFSPCEYRVIEMRRFPTLGERICGNLYHLLSPGLHAMMWIREGD